MLSYGSVAVALVQRRVMVVQGKSAGLFVVVFRYLCFLRFFSIATTRQV
jgi:hypothetical protein